MKELIDFLFVRDDSYVGLTSLGISKEPSIDYSKEISKNSAELESFYKNFFKPILYIEAQKDSFL